MYKIKKKDLIFQLCKNAKRKKNQEEREREIKGMDHCSHSLY